MSTHFLAPEARRFNVQFHFSSYPRSDDAIPLRSNEQFAANSVTSGDSIRHADVHVTVWSDFSYRRKRRQTIFQLPAVAPATVAWHPSKIPVSLPPSSPLLCWSSVRFNAGAIRADTVTLVNRKRERGMFFFRWDFVNGICQFPRSRDATREGENGSRNSRLA